MKYRKPWFLFFFAILFALQQARADAEAFPKESVIHSLAEAATLPANVTVTFYALNRDVSLLKDQVTQQAHVCTPKNEVYFDDSFGCTDMIGCFSIPWKEHDICH